MRTITYSEARQNLAKTMEQTIEDRTSIIITKGRNSACVLMSLDEYRSLEETAYLLRSPTNAKRLIDAIEELKAGEGTERELVE